MSFLKDWLNIIRNCSVDNTYKMAWAKAITEISLYKDYKTDEEVIEITLKEIAYMVIKYYWEQTIYFDLVQGSNPNKPPKILSLTKELIFKYQETTKSKQPIKFYKSSVETILEKEYNNTIKKIISTLKQDVSYRFLNLGKEKMESIYRYSKGDDRLYISKSNLQTLKDNHQIVFDIINLRWTEILEGFNHSPRISKKVRIIDIDNIKRSSLNKFRKYIDYENPHHKCFICGDKIIDETPSIDHVIPWSYLYDDNLWNLVYTHQSCNSIKNNISPSEEMICNLENRNDELYKLLSEHGIKNKVVLELYNAIEKDLVRKLWISSKS